MAGCAMIGQTMINVRASGARTRLSTFCAGFFLLILVVALGGVVAVIPMAALVAVMILVSVSTFDWHSIAPATLRRMPRGETAVMLATVAVTVATHNLALGVATGVVLRDAAVRPTRRAPGRGHERARSRRHDARLHRQRRAVLRLRPRAGRRLRLRRRPAARDRRPVAGACVGRFRRGRPGRDRDPLRRSRHDRRGARPERAQHAPARAALADPLPAAAGAH